MLRIGFIGGGKMAQAMAKGFVSAGLTKNETILASCIPQDTVSLQGLKELGIPSTFDNKEVVKQSEVVFLAVKPTVIPTVLQDVKAAVTSKNLFLSVAMGVTLKTLEQNLPAQSRVIRVMPNTPALVREGASVFVRGTSVNDSDAQLTKKLLDAIGTCEEVQEYILDPITALSGSGPAYIYVMIEALADGAVRMGLPRDLAYKLAAQTVKGAGAMVLETRDHPGKLKDDVTSPGGSTAAGLYQLERGGLRAAVIAALEEATKKCKEMAKVSH